MTTLERYPDPSEIRHTIGANGQLTINNVSGERRASRHRRRRGHGRVRSESGRSGWLPLTVRKSEGSLTIDVEKRGGSFAMFGTWFGCATAWSSKVSVPRGAWVTVNSVSADIHSHFLAGEQSYKTVSGDVELNADGGKVHGGDRFGRHRGPNRQPAEVSVNRRRVTSASHGAIIESLRGAHR